MSLAKLFFQNTGTPINKWAHYIPIYERYFCEWIGRDLLFVEIGTGQGGSAQMWKTYFGSNAKIVTIDIRPECKQFEDEQIKVRLGDQANVAFLQSIVDEFGAPDIVLDDGGHFMDQVNTTFKYLFPRLARRALYMVEDMHTAYWPGAGGGLRKPGTFIEEMKTLVDEINSQNPNHASQGAGDLPSSPLSKLVRSVHFYDSIVVVEKGAPFEQVSLSIPKSDGFVW